MRFSRLSDWLSWQETLHPHAVDLGLERLERTLQHLQWRHPSCPVITVGGTNGKGSCVALLSGMLGAAGYRVGTFTSPHLLRYNERITIAGEQVSDALLMAAFERIDAARGEQTLTFFEFNALAALLVFETAGLDAVVLEVGMGGRLDAVNVVDADVALVTSIALDHREWLGHDVETIAAEKAGIFRAARPAVFGSREMPAAIAAHAAALGSDLRRLGRDFDWTRSGERWSWLGRAARHENLPPPALYGGIQYNNAASVLAVLETLSARLPVSTAAVAHALQTVRLPGRFQVIDVSAVEWILDVAHNPAAARTLASQLQARSVAGRTIAVCGALGDKDVEGIAAELRGVFDRWIVAGLSGARALDPEKLASRLQQGGAIVSDRQPDVRSACLSAQRSARPADRIVVFGSFLTVAGALQWLRA